MHPPPYLQTILPTPSSWCRQGKIQGAVAAIGMRKNIILTTSDRADHKIYLVSATYDSNSGMFTVAGGKLTIQNNGRFILKLEGCSVPTYTYI
ncbi:MAG: hypothetical protein LBU24_06210 [Methanocalculaceae archaeon]|nr:hypothetical protein [Methanocalculaceae archaeon]